MPAHDPRFAQEFPSLAAALGPSLIVRREIGRGGMGVVFLALDVPLDRLVALKVLPPALALDPATRERFLREARTAARLAHPNVVPVYRADTAGDTAFFTMAYVEGESLAERVRDRGPLPPADAVPVLRDVAYALAYAHARGVVHRDVKPENILLERATGGAGGRTLVTDFGIARHADLHADGLAAHPDQAARLTQDGHVLGTVHYMSPEQVSGLPLDGRSDLYGLGVVAFQILTGRLPFEGLPAPAVLVAHATRPAPRLLDVAPHVPPALAAVVDRCLAKTPEARFPTGEALAEALGAALEAAAAADPERRQAAGDLPLRRGSPRASTTGRPPRSGGGRRSSRRTRCVVASCRTPRGRACPRPPTGTPRRAAPRARRRPGTGCGTWRMRRRRRASRGSTWRSPSPSSHRAPWPPPRRRGRASASARRRSSSAPTPARSPSPSSFRPRPRERSGRSAPCCSRPRSSCGCVRPSARTRSTVG
jgi:serine/threonine protein kinase